jgi:hypothetical protein
MITTYLACVSALFLCRSSLIAMFGDTVVMEGIQRPVTCGAALERPVPGTGVLVKSGRNIRVGYQTEHRWVAAGDGHQWRVARGLTDSLRGITPWPQDRLG